MFFLTTATAATLHSRTPLPANWRTELPLRPLQFLGPQPPLAARYPRPSNSPARKYALDVPYAPVRRSPHSYRCVPASRMSQFLLRLRRVLANPSSPLYSRSAAAVVHAPPFHSGSPPRHGTAVATRRSVLPRVLSI